MSYPGDFLGAEVLPLWRDAVGVFCNPNRLSSNSKGDLFMMVKIYVEPATLLGLNDNRRIVHQVGIDLKIILKEKMVFVFSILFFYFTVWKKLWRELMEKYENYWIISNSCIFFNFNCWNTFYMLIFVL